MDTQTQTRAKELRGEIATRFVELAKLNGHSVAEEVASCALGLAAAIETGSRSLAKKPPTTEGGEHVASTGNA